MPASSVPLSAIYQPAFLYDAGGRVVEANDLIESLAGRPLAGSSIAEVQAVFGVRPPGGTPYSLAELPVSRALRGEKAVDVPLAVTASDGRVLHVLATASPIRDVDTVTGALVVWQDVSGMVATEEALAERERLFSQAFHGNPAALAITRAPEYRYVDVNESWTTLFGHTREEAIGRTSKELGMFPENYAEREAVVHQTLEQGAVRNREIDACTGTGEVLTVLSSSEVVVIDGEQHILSAVIDVTERRRAEDERERLLRTVDANRRQLQALTDAIPAGVFIADATGRLVQVNEYAKRIWAGMLPADSWQEYAEWKGYWPDTGRQLTAGEWATARALTTGEAVLGDIVDIERFDGSRGTILNCAAPVTDADGTVVGAITINLDISAQRQTEALLREREQTLQSIFRAAPVGIGIASHRVIGSANEHLCRMTGYTPDELIGQDARMLYLSDEAYALAGDEKSAQTLENGIGAVETQWGRKDGRVIDVLLSSSPMDPSTPFENVVFVALDITDLHEKEAALRESEANMALAQSTAHLGNWAWDLATNLLSCSDEHCRLYGLAPGDYPIETFIDLVHEDDRQPVLDALAAALDGGTPYDVACRVVRPDGTERILHGEGAALRDRDGRVTGMFGIAQDITEQKKAEEALREYAENLRRSNDDLERYAYVSSHDLQEPLRAIVSFSQLLERRYKGQLGQDADEYIAFIVEGGSRMQTLIQDLLAYSRVNTKRQELRPTDTEEVLAAVERNLDLQLREAGAVLTHDPLPSVLADPLQLEQVLMNLVSNAIKFHRPDEPLRIHVGAQKTDGFWELSVKDNGIGIEPEYFDRIFVIFQRLHTREIYPGTGIGLAIVKRIIDRHGGKVRVESMPGEGTTFFFTVPDESFKGGVMRTTTDARRPPG
jgi:PAS domain S-box-containing protein